MSKAFTKEPDDLPEQPTPVRARSPLPPGARNYLTAQGAKRFRQELNHLLEIERPRLASCGSDEDVKQNLRALDNRVRELQRILETASVVPPPSQPDDQVRFGATVSVRMAGGQIEQYRIVGTDETDVERGWVSWISPIAKALLNSRMGDRVPFKFPSGEEELVILAVTYEGL